MRRDDVAKLKRLRASRLAATSAVGGEAKFLGALEAQIMDRVWTRGTATVRDIVEDLSRTRQLAYTTVMTIMGRLHQKGLLRRALEGKTYLYAPALSREQFRRRLSEDMVRGLVAEFGDVALAQFAAALGEVDESHRRSLRRLAEPPPQGRAASDREPGAKR